MFIKRIIFGLILFINYSCLFAQVNINGVVVDIATKQPVPYANIYLSDSLEGTSTNELGEFSLKLKTIAGNIIVSHVAYQKKIIPVNTEEPTDIEVELTPMIHILPEIHTSGNDALHFVYAALNKLNNSQNYIFAKGFYRQWARNGAVYTELMEKFYSSRLNAKGISEWKVDQGRYAIRNDVKKKKYLVNNNFSFFTKAIPVYQTDNDDASALLPLRTDADKLFNFKIVKFLQSNETDTKTSIAVIRFEPKKNNEKPGFEGEMYIDSENNLIRINALIDDERFMPVDAETKKVLSDAVLKYEASFTPVKQHSHNALQSVKIDFFAKQKIGEDEFKEIQVRSFFLNFHYLSEETSFSENSLAKSDVEEIDNTEYNDDFWENNIVLKRTPVEQDIIHQFKKTRSFGRMFQK